jgi:hypothetical protein
VIRTPLACTVLSLVLATGAARAEMDRFSINAQYRGAVKKGFADIGSAGLQYRATPGGEFGVRGTGKVTHPKDSAKTYQFNVDMKFRVDGETVQYVGSNNSCNPGSEGIQAKMEKILPFVYLAKTLPARAAAERSFRTPHGAYQMKWVTTASRIEVTLLSGRDMVSKFFLAREAGDGPHTIEKFRVPTKDNVVLSFVTRP